MKMSETRSKKTETKKGAVPKKTPKKQNQQSSGSGQEKSDFLTEASKSIESGVEVASEKISEFAGKTAETAGELYKAVKKGLSSTYDAGAKAIDEISNTAQDYIDKYKKNTEVNKLSEMRNQLYKKLGKEFFEVYKTKKEDTLKLFFNKKEILDLNSEIEKLNKDIVKIGKKLEKK
jgi:hypothetical protein